MSHSTNRQHSLIRITRQFPTRVGIAFAAFSALLLPSPVLAQDSVEFLNGTTLTGKITEIRAAEKQFDFESRVGDQSFSRTYSYAAVHAVTLNGKRFELTPQPKSASATATSQATTRSKSEVLDLIADSGKSLPDWFDSTPLDYPDSLDLAWPLKPEGPWNNQKNMGQFIWDVVNPNERRWRSGIKLVHHCMSLHEGNADLQKRDMQTLANMYFTLLQDYPRAAFWYQKAHSSATGAARVRLAECYWRLGNQQMAQQELRGKSLPYEAIKLFGEMGEIDRAIQLAQAFGKTAANNQALLAAGDVLRNAGRLEEATQHYQRVADADDFRNPEYEQRLKALALGSIEAIQLFDRADVSKVADGTYVASSTGYSGQVEVEVRVVDKKIEAVNVKSHREKQFYAATHGYSPTNR